MTRNKIYKIAVLVIFVSVVIFSVWGLNSYLIYSKEFKNFETEKAKLVSANENIERLNLLLNKLENEREEFEEYLFEEKDIPGFLDGISNSANETNVQIVDIKTKKYRHVKTVLPDGSQGRLKRKRELNKQQEAQRKKDVLENALNLAALPIDFKIKGTFSSLMRFLSSLQNFKQLVTITNIRIGRKREYPVLECDFILQIYSFKTLQELGVK